MPCLNEELTISTCVQKAMKAFADLGIQGEVIVADNGSTDHSVELAEALGARVIHQPIKGYGAALQAGIDAAQGQFVVMGDADDSYDWGDIGVFLPLLQEGCDLVMGNRFKGGIDPGAMPPLHRYLGNPVLSFVSRIAFRIPIGDFHCGMRAFSKEAYLKMRPRTTGMEFATEMIAAAAGNGMKVREVPLALHKDKRNRPPHLRSWRDGWRHLRFIVSHAPDHLYLYPGFALFILGGTLQIILALGPVRIFNFTLGIHFLALGCLLNLMGLNTLIFGLIAKSLVSIRYPKELGHTAMKFLKIFTLERGLYIGASFFIIGFLVDFLVLLKWLDHLGQSMESTVHPAFLATNFMILGVNFIFYSFLIHIIDYTESFHE